MTTSAYHGSGMHAELMRQATGLDWIANDHGFAVIYPDASDGFFPIPCPGCENDGRDGFEEINFAREIIRWTSETYAVHPDFEYAAVRFTHRQRCRRRPGRLRRFLLESPTQGVDHPRYPGLRGADRGRCQFHVDR